MPKTSLQIPSLIEVRLLTDFTKKIYHVPAEKSVRALMQEWLIPGRVQGELRMHRSILVNGAYIPVNAPVPADATVSLHYTGTLPTIAPSPVPIAVVYEDNNLLAVNKPAGVKTHPNKATDTDTMIARIGHYLGRPAFITHRLDMETSGILLVAKDPLTQAIINRQLAVKTAARKYEALVAGSVPNRGTIDAPIGHMDNDIRRRTVRADGQAARTHYRVVARNGQYATVALTLETGRTHQLRVHLEHLGFPIVGDPLYNPLPAPRMYLHAAQMELTQPFSKERLVLDCPAEFDVPEI